MNEYIEDIMSILVTIILSILAAAIILAMASILVDSIMGESSSNIDYVTFYIEREFEVTGQVEFPKNMADKTIEEILLKLSPKVRVGLYLNGTLPSRFREVGLLEAIKNSDLKISEIKFEN
jgi:L-cystine uptake protein TcyP (sodium:dicarboxylate symporter family)